MRMWMVPTYRLCNRHLLGEHNEIHMLEGCLKKGKNIEPFLHGLVFPSYAYARHGEIVIEMLSRGMRHSSNIDANVFPKHEHDNCYFPDLDHNSKELLLRCGKCRERKAK